jgi:hypothetical protein
VKWVTAAELKELVQDWTLELTGGLSDSIDRASFESCSAPQCHGSSWTDDQGQVWSGVPLWLLVGSVDDAVQHEGPAFNDDLASAGYTITVTASDGYSTEFDSATVARNPDILVAHLVDGQPLPEKYFPLRLVSSALAKNQLVGMISQIALGLEPVPPAAPAEAAAPSGEVVLTIDGPGDAMTEFTDADLRALGVVTKTLEHPKKGATEYEGVPLLAVLEAAGVTSAVETLELVASDGYSAEVPAAEVLACADCLLTFGETPGEYALAMPGLPSNAWVKGIARIEAK